MYMLGSPHVKGNSEEVAVHSLAKEDDRATMKAGVVVSQDGDGNVIPFDKKKPVLGITSTLESNGGMDILKRGYKVMCRIASGDAPNSGVAYVNDDGLVATSGDIIVGQFTNSNVATAFDNITKEDNVPCAMVDIIILYIGSNGSASPVAVYTIQSEKFKDTTNGANNTDAEFYIRCFSNKMALSDYSAKSGDTDVTDNNKYCRWAMNGDGSQITITLGTDTSTGANLPKIVLTKQKDGSFKSEDGVTYTVSDGDVPKKEDNAANTKKQATQVKQNTGGDDVTYTVSDGDVPKKEDNAANTKKQATQVKQNTGGDDVK